MELIALCMVSNYNKDAKDDKAIGKYNPLNEGKWDYDSISKSLINKIETNINTDISTIYTVEDAVRGYWQK